MHLTEQSFCCWLDSKGSVSSSTRFPLIPFPFQLLIPACFSNSLISFALFGRMSPEPAAGKFELCNPHPPACTDVIFIGSNLLLILSSGHSTVLLGWRDTGTTVEEWDVIWGLLSCSGTEKERWSRLQVTKCWPGDVSFAGQSCDDMSSSTSQWTPTGKTFPKTAVGSILSHSPRFLLLRHYLALLSTDYEGRMWPLPVLLSTAPWVFLNLLVPIPPKKRVSYIPVSLY